MARLDDLVARVDDLSLRREMEAALAEMKRRQRFGLVFEEHIPETTALFGLSAQPGALVQRRDDPAAKRLYRVTETTPKGQANIEPTDGGEAEAAAIGDLLVVKRFGEPVYPALTPLGSLRRGDDNKPHHAVINGENFHALQLLVYQFEGQVDCIYIDPPYNTGARDWKYNNRYVDDADAWRHSKWLSMMEKRLRLANRLLNRNGILICTIDEHEVHHLGVLLEQIFPAARRQLVTIVINPLGQARRQELGRVEEYAYFLFCGDAEPAPVLDDLLNESKEITEKKPRWERLLRGGTDSDRASRKRGFYPVFIDPKTRRIVEVGEPLPLEASRYDVKVFDSYVVVWPLRKNGDEGRWRLQASTLRRYVEQGFAKVGAYDRTNDRWSILYLGDAMQRRIEDGDIVVTGRDPVNGAVNVEYANATSTVAKTVWNRGTHRAGEYGSRVLSDFLGERRFPFPKSLYAVADTLRVAVGNNPDALIVDFFAGSGTTLHATALLNDEDGGRRRSIVVTNNEVEEALANGLRAEGYRLGDPEFERHGIFEAVMRPRCEAAVTGVRADGTPVEGEYLNGRPYAEGLPENVEFYRLDYLDPDEVDLGLQFEAILPALWMAAGGVGSREKPEEGQGFSMPEGSTYGVLFREARFRQFREALEERSEVTRVWLVTDSEEAYAEMCSALSSRLSVSMLYTDYLRNFRINTRRNL
jgi:adenine-specific DNA-methyltransferase